jgi:hypothetical protein
VKKTIILIFILSFPSGALCGEEEETGRIFRMMRGLEADGGSALGGDLWPTLESCFAFHTQTYAGGWGGVGIRGPFYNSGFPYESIGLRLEADNANLPSGESVGALYLPVNISCGVTF